MVVVVVKVQLEVEETEEGYRCKKILQILYKHQHSDRAMFDTLEVQNSFRLACSLVLLHLTNEDGFEQLHQIDETKELWESVQMTYGLVTFRQLRVDDVEYLVDETVTSWEIMDCLIFDLL